MFNADKQVYLSLSEKTGLYDLTIRQAKLIERVFNMPKVKAIMTIEKTVVIDLPYANPAPVPARKLNENRL